MKLTGSCVDILASGLNLRHDTAFFHETTEVPTLGYKKRNVFWTDIEGEFFCR